ncbi:cytochrome D1 domain-containing protein [Halomonas sp. PR-M31]|uniref:cytochrome D1 domain-containing protein n=1 Tax=Halomonas sp. PR-M31 TaxID=1471202 RepID=UPI000AECC3F1|nr:cytochrome D1 domain-containing protein [Halomonas sp. PR-M31]
MMLSSLFKALLPFKTLLIGSAFALLAGCQTLTPDAELRGTGDLGVVVERATGSVLIVDTSERAVLKRIEGLGDLSHASVKFSRDARYAFVFGRDGGLSKVDILTGEIIERVIQSGNSIGGAISQKGDYVAVSNYEPGGVKIFDSADLALVANIPATYQTSNGDTKRSKTVGLVDVPGNDFVFSLFDAGEIWTLDMVNDAPQITRFDNIGEKPYDGMISPNGRYYIAGLFGEDGLALLDLWHTERGVERILPDYGRGEERLPVYKMPHLEGWTIAGNQAYFPAVGHHEVLVANARDWTLENRIPVHGQPVFVMSRPDERQVWVNFAHPKNDVVQVIDTQSGEIIKTLSPGKSVLHMEFTPRGEQVWISARDSDQIKVYDTETFEELVTLPAKSPSGIFFTDRAHRIGL